jgi:hypothetical protein
MMPPWKPALDANAPLSKWAPPWDMYSLTLTEKFKDLADCQATISRLKHLVKSRPQDFRRRHFHPPEDDV